MPEKFETQFEKVVGGNEQHRAKAKIVLQEWLEDANDIPQENEIKKTEGDIRLIEETEKDIYEIVRGYGGSPKQMPMSKIHIVPRDMVKNLSKKKFSGGFHDVLGQYIVVGKGRSEIAFTCSLAHELLHKASYKSANINETRSFPNIFKKKNQIALKRSGIVIFDFEKNPAETRSVYFNEIEEAIVAKTQDIFIQKKLRADPKYTQSFKNMDRIKSWMAHNLSKNNETNTKMLDFLQYMHAIEGAEQIMKVLDGNADYGYKLGYLYSGLYDLYKKGLLLESSRIEEQELLNGLLDELVADGVYRNEEEAFGAFARANFSGNLLPLARDIENQLGKGSFRKLAERFKKLPKKRDGIFESLKRLLYKHDKI